jgi:hypothetical protein
MTRGWCGVLALAVSALLHGAAFITTGPEVGEKIPALRAKDQSGKMQTLETLRGPKGLVLVFVRSADW